MYGSANPFSCLRSSVVLRNSPIGSVVVVASSNLTTVDSSAFISLDEDNGLNGSLKVVRYACTSSSGVRDRLKAAALIRSCCWSLERASTGGYFLRL